MTKKQLKQLKKEIVENTAIECGFATAVMEKIPSYSLLEAVREITANGWQLNGLDDMSLNNILLTESVKAMNYQDFKEIAPYFFGYNRYA